MWWWGEGGGERNLTFKFAKLLNCSHLSLPFTYLGIPIGANPRRVETWKGIIVKN